MNSVIVIATHTCPDLDSVAATNLYYRANPEIKGKSEILFLKGGDENLSGNIDNVVFLDRGRGEFDHRGQNTEDTSASMVAKKFKLTEDPVICKLLKHVDSNDRKGITKPFTVADNIKRMAHNSKISDKQRMQTGLRIVDDVIEFGRLKLKRDPHFVAKIIKSFVDERELTGSRLEKYCRQIQNERFTREFDLVEVLSAEREIRGAKSSEEFAKELLEFIAEDELNFWRAIKELRDAKRVGCITMGYSDNPVFNKAARYKGALVIIQKSKIGMYIFFDFKKIKQEWIDNIMAAIRLEEQILQKKKNLITKFNILKKAERLREIEEWYYYVSSDQKGGRFILNRSLTAPDPDIPETRISADRMILIVQSVLRFRDEFDFQRYALNCLKRSGIFSK